MVYAKFYTLPKYSAGSDTWRFYRMSLEETKWLLNSPAGFVKDLFHYGYTTSGNIFSGENSYWNDLKSNLPVKILAICNVVTSNSYYANIILFNFFFLFGLVAVFKVLFALYPTKKWIVITGIFLLPSTLFWCSGIHKDGLVLSAIGSCIYCFYKISTLKYCLKHLLIILFTFLLIFSLRNYILFALLPALLCWILYEKASRLKKWIIPIVYLTGLICFFTIPLALPSVNPPLYFANKQWEFLQLTAGSLVPSAPLEPTATGFISFLPNALDMAFFRPHVNEFKNLSYIPAIAENLLLLILILLSIFTLEKKILFLRS